MQNTLCTLLLTCLLVPSHATAEERPAVSSPLRSAAIAHATSLGRNLPNVSPGRRQGQAPRRRWVSRHPVLFGALVGFGAGAGSGGLLCLPDDGGDIPCSIYAAGYGALGAGIGAGIGLAVAALRR